MHAFIFSSQDHGRLSGVWCGVFCVCACGVPLLPSLPPLLKKRRELSITGIFPARESFFITVLNEFKKNSPPGKITGITVLY